MSQLPRGIYYERQRRRYRVRLYYCQTVFWRTYHTNLEGALRGLSIARRARLQYVRNLSSQPPKQLPMSVEDLLR